jgi:hypothetical protein
MVAPATLSQAAQREVSEGLRRQSRCHADKAAALSPTRRESATRVAVEGPEAGSAPSSARLSEAG